MNLIRKMLSLMIAVLLVICMCCSVPVSASNEPAQDENILYIEGTSLYSEAFEVLRLLNELRIEKGLHPLIMDADLLEPAMQRAAECNVYYSHTRPDGSDCYTISNAASGENIASGNYNAEHVMQAWVNSPGHYANMMREDITSVGIGAVDHITTAWTQVFGRGNKEVNEIPVDTERVFAIDIGSNTCTFDIINLPNSMLVTDKLENKMYISALGEFNEKERAKGFLPVLDYFEWSTDTPDILQVSEKEIVALSEGIGTIKAQFGRFVATADVEVKEFSKGSSKSCGDNITWKYNNGTLLLTGDGDMYDYTTYFDYAEGLVTDAPWNEAFSVVKNVVVGEGVTSVGKFAFSNFHDLEEVELPSSLKNIENCAFQYSYIKKVNIPQNVTRIGAYAFEGCINLESIELPESVTEIGNKAFYNCSSLKEIKLPSELKRIENDMFSRCSSLEFIEMPKNLEYIDSWAFYGCDKLKMVTFPEGTESIWNQDFYNCIRTTGVTVPRSVTDIGEAMGYKVNNSTGEKEKITDFTIYGYKDTAAEAYAQENGFNFVDLDASSCSYLVGDADLDSTVSIKDATAIQKHLAGLITLSEVGKVAADTDENTELNIKDATAIQKYIAGLYTGLHIGEEAYL